MGDIESDDSWIYWKLKFVKHEYAVLTNFVTILMSCFNIYSFSLCCTLCLPVIRLLDINCSTFLSVFSRSRIFAPIHSHSARRNSTVYTIAFIIDERGLNAISVSIAKEHLAVQQSTRFAFASIVRKFLSAKFHGLTKYIHYIELLHLPICSEQNTRLAIDTKVSYYS